MGNPKAPRSKIFDSDRRSNPLSNANSNTLVEESIDFEKLEQEKKIAELERKLNLLLSGQSVNENSVAQFQDEPLNADTYIPIVSLRFDTLNLSTREIGKGVIAFTYFGQKKQIVYSDLIRIMENHPTFLNKGYFYIMDSRVVRKHGLDEVYTKILTKDMIDQILMGNRTTSIELYKSAGESQREVINDALVKKLIEGSDIDLNVVDSFSKISGVDILEKARISKEYMEAEEEPEK